MTTNTGDAPPCGSRRLRAAAATLIVATRRAPSRKALTITVRKLRPACKERRGRAVLFALVAVAVDAACAPPQAITDRGYALVYHETFDGPAAPPIWEPASYGGSLDPTVADGMMTLRTTAANNRYWGYVASTGPRVEGEPSYPDMQAWQEGYFEARLRYSDQEWAWPAFWLYGAATTEAEPGEDCRYLTPEWDIMENGVANSNGERTADHGYVSVAHRNTGDGTSEGYCGVNDETRHFLKSFPDIDLNDWHIWGARWEGERLCTYLDNVEIQCMDAYDSFNQPMHIVFTIQYLRDHVCPNCGPKPAELEMQVDWVRVYQRT